MSLGEARRLRSWSQGRSGRRDAARRWRRRGRRGVSDVVATILLLALTVTLFATIFAFVTRFPSPSPQDVNQFEASVNYTATGISTLRIFALSGPSIPSSDHIYLQSSRAVTNWQFSMAAGIPVGWGVGNASSWNAGQYWTTTFSPALALPTNITIYILSATTLLFTGTVPGSAPNTPPIITSTYTIPATPTVGQAFQIFAAISGNTTGLSVNVTLGQIPGLSGTHAMTFNATQQAYAYSVASGATTTNGTYSAYVQGAGVTGTVSGSVTVTIGSGSGGGGGGSNPITVSVGVDPQPPPVPGPTTAVSFAATITYTGSATNVPVSVVFQVAQDRPGPGLWPTSDFVTTLSGPSGVEISGPSTITLFSTTTFSGWLLNSPTANTPTVYANVTLTGVGTATGSAYIPALPTSLQGFAYFTTSSSTTTTTSLAGLVKTFASCTGTTCPYLFLTVWNNYTSQVSYSGTVWTNSSAGGHTHSYTVASTTVNAASTSTINIVGGTTRWSLPTGGGTGNYNVVMWLTVTSGGVPVGYIYSSFVGDYT